MTPEAHRLKAERIEASLVKCYAEDYEAVIEGSMLAGSHWFNLALHAMGITSVQEDALHAEYLSAALRLKVSLIKPAMLEALDFIERARAGYVRGNLQGGIEAAQQCRLRLELIRRSAEAATRFDVASRPEAAPLSVQK